MNLNPPPPQTPPPGRSEALRRSGPHLAQTWCQRRWKNFFQEWWGVRIDFTLCAYAQDAQNFVWNSNMHAEQEKKFTPDLLPPKPPPPPPIWLLGLDPEGVNFFFQKPHLCAK